MLMSKFFEVSQIKGVLIFGKKKRKVNSTLYWTFWEPWQSQWLGLLTGSTAYLSMLYNIFYMFMLRKYAFNSLYILNYNALEVQEDLTYGVSSWDIFFAYEKKVFWRRNIAFVNILWKNWIVKNATWEHEEKLKEEYS